MSVPPRVRRAQAVPRTHGRAARCDRPKPLGTPAPAPDREARVSSRPHLSRHDGCLRRAQRRPFMTWCRTTAILLLRMPLRLLPRRGCASDAHAPGGARVPRRALCAASSAGRPRPADRGHRPRRRASGENSLDHRLRLADERATRKPQASRVPAPQGELCRWPSPAGRTPPPLCALQRCEHVVDARDAVRLASLTISRVMSSGGQFRRGEGAGLACTLRRGEVGRGEGRGGLRRFDGGGVRSHGATTGAPRGTLTESAIASMSTATPCGPPLHRGAAVSDLRARHRLGVHGFVVVDGQL